MNNFPEMESENNPFQEKGSEMDSEMSSCSCFLLRQLFLVQKSLEHARGAARERRAKVIGTCLSQGGHLFLNHFLELFFSLKIVIVDKKRFQNGVKMRSCGTYF